MPNIKIRYADKDCSIQEEVHRDAQVIPVPYIFVDLFNVKTGKLLKRFSRESFISVELLRPATEEQISKLCNKD